MSSIFDLLGGLAESDGGQIKPMARSKTSNEIKVNSLKTMGGAKPKGLSIRSNSDMNISSIHSARKSTHDKEQDCLKLRATQVDNKGRPISPGKQTPTKKLTAQSFKLKESTPKEDSNKCTKKQLNDGVFKKPLLPKKNIRRTPKPEKLAYWCNDQHDFDYGYVEAVENEFKHLLCKGKENIKPSDKNIFLSDSENLFLDIPKLVVDKSFNEEPLSPNLPEVSDVSDSETL
ncbi:PREDICTED: uncharacterized protein LOC105564734 [Vollenhovia emeryi]|uniref:uncharacterized protein LOC105564734 n=1 Tax=Vollenhovia emeryi TaxID=411798 RepID=UPI0005F4413C|nr:PREDICTED: uncharacterized protein LOC105564734 [Vollenhovia emeryi]